MADPVFPTQNPGESDTAFYNRLFAFSVQQNITNAANSAAALNRQAAAMEQQVVAQGNLQSAMLLTAKMPLPVVPTPDSEYVFSLMTSLLQGGADPATALSNARTLYSQFRAAYPKSTPAPK